MIRATTNASQNPAPQGPFGQYPADNLLSNAAAPSGWMELFAGGAMPSGVSSSRKRKAETESGAQDSLDFVVPPPKKVSRKRQTNIFPFQSIPQSGAFQFPPNPLHRHSAEDSVSGIPGSFGMMGHLSGTPGLATGRKRKAEAIPETTIVDGRGLDMPLPERISRRQQTNINPTQPCMPFSGTASQYPASQSVLCLDITGDLGAVPPNVPDPCGVQNPFAGRTIPAAGHSRVKMNTEKTFPQGVYPSSRWPVIVPPPRRVAHEQDIGHPRPGPVPGPSSSADPRLGIGSAGLERGSFRSLFSEPGPPSLPMPGPDYPVWHTQTVASISNAPKYRPRKAHQKKRYQVIVVDRHGRRVSSQEIEDMLGIRSIYPPDYEFPGPFPGCNIFFREEDLPENIQGNSVLRRHVRDHHLELLAVRCSCGALIRRGMADVIERHLQTMGHRVDRQRLGLRSAAIDTLTGNIQTFIKEEDEDTVGNNVGLDRNDEDRQEGTSDGRRHQGN